jgi:hypothetical protein
MRLGMRLLESFNIVMLEEIFVFNFKKIKFSMLFEFIIRYYYWCFKGSWSQIGISCLKWILIFLTVLVVGINHKHCEH